MVSPTPLAACSISAGGDAMEVTTIRLSTEELALILAQMGHVEASKGLIATQLGLEASPAQMQARMLTAAHGLLASGWLDLDKDGNLVIDPELQRIAGVLTEAKLSIRYSRAEQAGERFVTYHITESGVFEHFVEYGIVHAITELPHIDAILDGGVDFLEVAETLPFAAPSFEVPFAVLSEINDERDVGAITQRLQRSGVPPAAAPLLAEDVAGEQYRGSALRVEYNHDAQPFSDHGLLLLRGPQRLWLMRQAPQSVTLLPGTEEAFRREVAALVQ
jgi:hypothetical protein